MLLPPAHRIQRPAKVHLPREPPVLQRATRCLLGRSRILKPKPSSSPSTIRGNFRPSRFLSTLLRTPRSAERSLPSPKFKKTCTCPPACRLISKARPHRFATRSPTCHCSSLPPSSLFTLSSAFCTRASSTRSRFSLPFLPPVSALFSLSSFSTGI